MRRFTALLAALSLAVTAGLSGCGKDGADSAATGSATLRVGYQRFGGLSLVKTRAAAPGVSWSLFESGPALTSAQARRDPRARPSW